MNRVVVFALLAACKQVDSWAAYESGPGRYRIEFPGHPELKTQQTPSYPTITTSYQAVVDRGAHGDFQVNYYELNVGSNAIGDFAKAAQKIDCSGASERGWTSVATFEPKLAAVTGFQADFAMAHGAGMPDGGFEQDRCFVIGSRMYHLTTVGPNTPDQRRDSARFLDSFQVL